MRTTAASPCSSASRTEFARTIWAPGPRPGIAWTSAGAPNSSGGALIQREQFEDLVRVDFDRGLGLRGSNFKGDAEAETPVPEPLAPCTAFIDDTRELLAEFLRAVRGEAEPVTTARDHLKTLLVVQACIESMEKGAWVRLRDVHERFAVPGPRGIHDE